MTIVRSALAGALLAALPLLSAHTQMVNARTAPAVTLTVALTLNTPVPSGDTFSAFIGALAKCFQLDSAG